MSDDRRVALITGASSGLGLETARALAILDYRLLLVVRNRERGEAAQAAITASAQAAGRLPTSALLLADLSSQADIRALAGEVARQTDRLDLLINNAGNSFTTRQVSPDGIEMTLAVNHLAAFLLTHLLLDLLKAGRPARIVNVGSRVNAKMELDDLQWERRPYSALAAYAQSKVGTLHFSFGLAERLSADEVTVNCVHPGVFQSNLGATGGPQSRWMETAIRLSKPLLTPTYKAAARVVWVATAPELAGVSGKYFGNRVELPAAAQALDRELRARVWRASEELTGLAAAA